MKSQQYSQSLTLNVSNEPLTSQIESQTINNVENFDKIEMEIPPKKESSCSICLQKLNRKSITFYIWIGSLISSIFVYALSDSVIGTKVCVILLIIVTAFNFFLLNISSNTTLFSVDSLITIIASYAILSVKLILFILDYSAAFIKEGTSSNETGTETDPGTETESGIGDQVIMYLWIAIYWLSIVLNFIVLKFQIIYWTQEHPNCLKRIFISVKTIKFRIICSLILFLVIALTLSLSRMEQTGDPLNYFEPYQYVSLSIIIVNLVFSTIYYIFTLGTGLVSFPMMFINYTNTSENLRTLVKDFMNYKKEYEASVNKFVKNGSFVINICENVKKCEGCPQQLQYYCDKLINIIEVFNEKDFTQYNDFIDDDENILTDCVEKNGTNYVQLYPLTTLTDLYVKHVKKFYLDSYTKKVVLLRYYIDIKKHTDMFDSLTIIYKNEQIKEKIQQQNNSNVNFINPNKYSTGINVITKIIGVIFFILSLFVFAIHFMHVIFVISPKTGSFIFNIFPNDRPQISILFFSVYILYILVCCVHSFKTFNRFNDYILIRKNSDKFLMANNISFINKVTLGLLYHLIFFYLTLKGDYEPNNNNLEVFILTPITSYYNKFQIISIIKYIYSFVLVLGLLFIVILGVLRLFDIHFKQLISLIENKEVYELYDKKSKSNEQSSNEFLDENVIYSIERFEKEYLNDIIDIQM